MVCVGAFLSEGSELRVGLRVGTLLGKVGCVKLSKQETKRADWPPNDKQEGNHPTAKSVVWREEPLLWCYWPGRLSFWPWIQAAVWFGIQRSPDAHKFVQMTKCKRLRRGKKKKEQV